MSVASYATQAAERPWRRILVALAALLLLNGLLSFSTWWPTPGIVPDHRLAPEFVWLWIALLAIVGLRGALSVRAAGVLAAAYLALVLGRYLDVTAPALFGRPINLYWDAPQVPRFLWVSAQELPWAMSLAIAAALLAALWALTRLLRWAILVTAREAVPYALRAPWTWVLSALAVALVLANYAGVRATWPLVSKPVLPTYLKQAELIATAQSAERMSRILPPSTRLDAAFAAPDALGGLAGRDVYLLFLESYGAMVFDDPQAAPALAEARARFAAELAASGRGVVSARVGSPTIGGASDLAHLSLLSGIDLADPRRHDLLLTTGRPTLIGLFKARGYQTFGLYPAVFWEWPERAYYGFDVYLEGRSLDYRGPALGYWKIPDQAAFARFEQRHPRVAGTPPRFVFFPTISSHFPFSPVPPYQPDWNRVLEDQPFDPEATQRALAATPNWLDMRPDYLRTIEYTWRWLGSFLQRPEPRETVFVLLGDHQPTTNVSGAGASWDVPVHIVSSDERLLARFEALGFARGLDPGARRLGNMNDLTGLLLDGFAPEPAAARAAAPNAVPPTAAAAKTAASPAAAALVAGARSAP